jgi:hypothetical protein
MPLHDLIEPSDCITVVAKFLEPHELQALRCVNKGLKRSITGSIRHTAIEETRFKYSFATRMPDGAIRMYTELGRRKFDMYTIPDSYYSSQEYGAKTPMYTLKQDGQADQIGHMTHVGDSKAFYTGINRPKVFTEKDRNEI